MKKVFIILTTLILSFILTQWQINRINQKTLQDYTEVYLFSHAIEKGTIINAKDISLGKVNSQWFSDDYFKSEDEIIGKKLAVAVEKNTIVIQSALLEQTGSNFIPNGMGLTSVKISPEAALCWQFEEGDTLTLFYVDQEGQAFNWGDVQVFQKLTTNLSDHGDAEDLSYIMVLAKNEIIKGILSKRDEGRLEFVKVNEKQ